MNNVPVVNENFVYNSIERKKVEPTDPYVFSSDDPLECVGVVKSENDVKITPLKRKRGVLKNDVIKSEDSRGEVKKRKIEKVKGIPIPLKGTGLRIKGKVCKDEKSGEYYDVCLSQSERESNINKFYKIQLVNDANSGIYLVYCEWGRVGGRLYKLKKRYKEFSNGIKEFEKRFLEKTGNVWDDKNNLTEFEGKYSLVIVDHANEEIEEKSEKKDDDGDVKMKDNEAKCNLDERVVDFINRISSKKMFGRVLKEFKIDIKKFPLGKLSKQQIESGFAVLKQLETVIKNCDKYGMDAIIKLNDEYNTKIPQSFGLSQPPLISTIDEITEKVKMLTDLRDMEIATAILEKTKRSKDPVTSIYEQLNCKIEPIETNSQEYSVIKEYVTTNVGPTHGDYVLKIKTVFRITRSGENEKYSKKFLGMKNKQMLWHGSRISNFMGILSEGLRIAPPSAPVTGYMFGKGVYFADMVTKASNYCKIRSGDDENNVGAVLLSEVALGNQLKLCKANPMMNRDGLRTLLKDSVWGCGRRYVPRNLRNINNIGWPIGRPSRPIDEIQSDLIYNEFVVYDEDQVNIKYLVLFEFDFEEVILID